MKNFFKRLAYSAIWNALLLLFGLIQLGFVIIRHYMQESAPFSFDQTILDGVIIFYCTALVCSVVLDYFLGSRKRYSKIFEAMLFYVFPFVILAVAIYIYATCTVISEKDMRIAFIRQLELVLLVMTMGHSLLVKAILFRPIFKWRA